MNGMSHPPVGRSLGPVFALLGMLALLPALISADATEIVVRELEIDSVAIDSSGDDRWSVVTIDGGLPEVPLGAPALPSIRVRLPIADHQLLTGVAVTVLESEQLHLRLPVEPYAGEMSSMDAIPPTQEPKAEFYPAGERYPSVLGEVVGTVKLSRGERYAVVRVSPLQVTGSGRELIWAKRISLAFTLEDEGEAEVGLRRERPVRWQAPAGAQGRGTVLLAEQGFLPRSLPSVEGSPVQYVIVSPPDEAMKQEWQRLADWKTACGVPTLVIDTDWIRATYPQGADMPDRIRHFIRDGYVNWGLKWVLLGADVSLIPTRHARSWSYNTGSPQGTDVACDYYYACLEGTWDADQDGIFGESTRYGNIGDDVDFTPEVQVGRVSAKTAGDVTAFLEKYFVYVGEAPDSPSGDGYLDRMLFLGEVLFHKRWELTGRAGEPDCGSGEECNPESCRTYRETTASGHTVESLVCVTYDAASDVFRLEDVLVDEIETPLDLYHLFERDYHWAVERPDLSPFLGPLNYETTMTALSEGYACVHHIGHGDRDRWAIGDGRLLISDLADVTNGSAGGVGRFYWVYGTNCNSAAIDYDSFGEQFLIMPNHGVVGYIGCTNVDYPTTARAFSEDFYRFAFGSPGGTIGDGFFGANAANALTGASINTESTRRFLLFALTLLGEPGMMLWHGTPGDMTVAFDSEPSVGVGTLTVTVSDGAAVAGATVCVWKEGEVYSVVETDAGGVADVPFWAGSEGDFRVTVTSATHRPVVGSGTVRAPSGPALVFGDVTIIDDGQYETRGNGDGALDRSETAALAMAVRNDGDASASDVQVSLAATPDTPAGVVTLDSSSWTIGTLAPGSEATSTSELQLTVATNPPEELFGDADRLAVPLDVLISSSSGSYTSTFEFSIVRPRFATAINEWPQASGTNRQIQVAVENVGKGTASDLKAILTADNDYVYVSNSTLYPEDIAPGETALLGPYNLSVTDANLAQMTFRLYDVIVSPGEPLHERSIDLTFPAPPDSFGTIGLPDGMVLGWSAGDAQEALAGYRVYRAPQGSNDFQEIHGGILRNHRRMIDEGLDHLALYRYRIRSVDEGGNLGAASGTVESYTSPGMAEGWPNFLREGKHGSPMICELDNVSTIYGDRALREIVFPGDRLYVYHGNGIEMVDGDGVASTSGVFSDFGANFHGRAAAGDLDADGEMEVVAISFADSTVYCWTLYGDQHKWAFKYPVRNAWNSPVLADLDNNGTLEVIFIGGRSGHEGIYVLKHDGTPFKAGTNGQILDLGDSYLYHPAAVGDVDGDGYKDIVIGTRSGRLYAVRGLTGNALPGFAGGISFEDLGHSGGCRAPVTLADVDGVPGDEIFALTRTRLFCVDRNGLARWSHPHSVSFPMTTSWDLHPEPVLGDVNGDGYLDVVYVEAGGQLNVLRAIDGAPVSPFPIQLYTDANRRYGSCILANVDQDYRPEIIFGDSNSQVHAYTYQGQIARGFPIQFTGGMDMKSLAAWDTDDDGYQNLVVQAQSVQAIGIYHMEGVVFEPTHNPWPMARRDSFGTGRMTSESPVPVLLYIEQAVARPDGTVEIAWRSGEPALTFHVYRAGPQETVGDLIGSVAAVAGGGIHTYRFSDFVTEPGVYRYEIRPVGLDGQESSGARFTLEVGARVVSRLALQRVIPNPLAGARPSTIEFTLPGAANAEAPVRLKVLDLQGRVVRTLMEGKASAGPHSVEWDGRDQGGRWLPTGLYLIRLESGVRAQSTRMLLVR